MATKKITTNTYQIGLVSFRGFKNQAKPQIDTNLRFRLLTAHCSPLSAGNHMVLPRAVSRVGRCCHPSARNSCCFDGTCQVRCAAEPLQVPSLKWDRVRERVRS